MEKKDKINDLDADKVSGGRRRPRSLFRSTAVNGKDEDSIIEEEKSNDNDDKTVPGIHFIK